MEVTISHVQVLHLRGADLFGFIDGWRKHSFPLWETYSIGNIGR